MPFTIRPHNHVLLQVSHSVAFWSLTLFLLLSVGTAAYAEWVVIAESGADNEANQVTVYADVDTVRRKGELVKWWQLADYTTVQTASGGEYLSMRYQKEYDCAEELMRILAATTFAGHMGKGKVVKSFEHAGKWKPVAPGSIAQITWKAACGQEQ